MLIVNASPAFTSAFTSHEEQMPMRNFLSLVFSLIGIAILPQQAAAHFVLDAPQSWMAQNQVGDPQKPAPCGIMTKSAGTPSNVITKVTGGQKLHLKIREIIYHPGHYRVALAVNTHSELPPDPQTTTRETASGPWSVSAVIQNPVRPPLLADGLFAHTAPSTAPFETDIEIPNINCVKCTLQVIQWMAEHALNPQGDFSYHHCADLQITADPAKPIDIRWPKQR